MLLEIFSAPLPATEATPYVPGHRMALPVDSVASVAEDTTNRAWAVVHFKNINGTYSKVICAMNYEQVVAAWQKALHEHHMALAGVHRPFVYTPGPLDHSMDLSQDPFFGRNIGLGSQREQKPARLQSVPLSPASPPEDPR